MSNVSTFGAFTMAKLGIYASQKAMQVTGNNITNINTAGYTRQTLELKSLYVGGSDRCASKWDAKTGSGVLVTGVNQIRSPYLDIRYRTSNSTLGALQAESEGLSGLSAIFDEIGKGEDEEGVMEAALQALIEQMEYYDTDGAGQATYDSILRGSSKQIVDLFNTYATKLETLYKGHVESLHQDVTDVNTILKEIQRLNNSIRKAEIHGSNALELKDERNVLIDNLSSYIRINVLYEEEDVGAGQKVDKLVIKLDSNDPHSPNDGKCLVDGKYVTQLEVPALNIPDTGNTTIPVETVENWDQFNVSLDELRDIHGNPRMKVEGMSIAYAYGFAEGKKLKVGDKVTIDDVEVEITNDDVVEGDPPEEIDQVKVLRKIANKYYDRHKDDENGWNISLNNTLDGLIFTSKNPAQLVEDKDTLIADKKGRLPGDDGYEETYALVLPAGMPEPPTITVTPAGGTAADNTVFENRIVNKGLEPVPYPQGRIDLTDNDLYGALQSSREMLTERGSFATVDDVARDPDAVSKRGIPYYIKMWDAMAVKFAKTMNDANTLEEKDSDGNVTGLIKDANGDYIVHPHNYFVVNDKDEYVDAKGNVIARKGSNGEFVDPSDSTKTLSFAEMYEKGVVRDWYKGGVLFSNSGDTSDPTGITAKNISVSFDWDKDAIHVMQSRTDSRESISSDNSNLTHMVSILKNNKHVYSLSDDTELIKVDNPNNFLDIDDKPIPAGALVQEMTDPSNPNKTYYKVIYNNDVDFFKGDYGEFLTKVASTLATDTSVNNDRLFDSKADVTELLTDRDSVSGVDLNDEAIAMMQYNKSYAAACRFMTQLDEMLDKLINGTAI